MTIIGMERRNKSCKEFTISRRDKPMNVAEALQRVVSRASCEGRLVTGITETATALQSAPASSIMFCVLENKSDDDIQMVLLEAFCSEYKIKLIKVNHCQKLCSEEYSSINCITSKSDCDHARTGKPSCKFTLTENNLTCKDSETFEAGDTSHSTCLLMKQPAELSSADEFVLAFYETYRYCKNAYPIVRLSDR